jgi:hypothetical protein
MTQENSMKPKPCIMRYTVKFKIWMDKNKERTETFIVSEFIEESPIVARQKAIEHYKKINTILDMLEEKGMLGYTDTIIEDGISNGEFYGEIFYRDVYYMMEDMMFTDDSGFDIVDNLINEYNYYIEQGFETGETEDIKDNRGCDVKILPFRLLEE